MPHRRRDGFATLLGVVVFLAGIAIIGVAFWQAWLIFSISPKLNLGVETGKPIDFNTVGLNFVRLLVRILMLVVMAGIGSMLANRGVRMYASGRAIEVVEDPIPVSEKQEAVEVAGSKPSSDPAN